MRKMTKIHSVVICTVVVFIFAYWVGTWNFYLGSNSTYFNTAFDCKGTCWESEELKITGDMVSVLSGKYEIIVMEVQDRKGKYWVCPVGDSKVEFCRAGNLEEIICSTSVRYKKRWGKIVSFKLVDVDKENWLQEGNDKIVFKLRK